MADFVAAIEGNGVIDDRTEKVSPFGQRLLPVNAEVILGPNGLVTVCAPFEAEIGGRPVEAPVIEAPPRNPIRRAMQWNGELQANPALSARTLARRDRVSAALVCLHLKLLQLSPEILTFTEQLETSAALRVFSYRKLSALRKCAPSDQVVRFNALRSLLPAQ